MRLKILENKAEFLTNLQERIINLLGLTFIVPNNYSIDNIEIVDDYTEMRIDTIAHKHYGFADYCDGLLKFNGISNPFSIEKGDVLAIPSKKTLDQSYVLARSNADQTLLLAQFTDLDKKKMDSKAIGLPPTFINTPTVKRIKENRIILE